MSHVFNQELQRALKDVYTELEVKRLMQQNLEKAAKIGLYYAHGLTDKAENKLEADREDFKSTGELLQQATNFTAVCDNIVIAATAAASDAQNTKSAVSTAAVNIQAAADALTNLAADVAAIYAVATSKDYGSKIQKLAGRSNDLTRLVAEKAEAATLQALSATIEATESGASATLAQAKTLNQDVKTLATALAKNMESLQTKIADDTHKLNTAIAQEKEKDGIYQTALQEDRALQYSERFIGATSNYDISYIKVGTLGDQFKVGFNRFTEDQYLLNDGDLQKVRVLKEYRVIFTKWDDSAAFDVQAAKAAKHYTSVVLSTIKAALKASDTAADSFSSIQRFDFELSFAADEYFSSGSDHQSFQEGPIKAVDFKGESISQGVPYAIFVYAVYTDEYQNQMRDTDGLLSLPSLPFILLTDLPRTNPPSLEFYPHRSGKGSQAITTIAMRVRFTVDELLFNGDDLRDLTDFRVILFKEKDRLAAEVNQVLSHKRAVLFELDQICRQTEQNFLDAQQAYQVALATGEGDLPKLTRDLEEAEASFILATDQYEPQQASVNQLNRFRGSGFFFDAEILESIPDAYTLTAVQVKESDQSYPSGSERTYMAINQSGDITDNYGEPLLYGERYVALVLSAVKSDEPSNYSLFQPVYSEFSAAEIFTLQQL